MDRFIPLEKRSKKEQKAFHDSQRRGWNGVNHCTRSMPDGRTYNRKKIKKDMRLGLTEEDLTFAFVRVR